MIWSGGAFVAGRCWRLRSLEFSRRRKSIWDASSHVALKFAQVFEVGLCEEVFQRGFDAFRGIDFSVAEAFLQVLGGEVDVHHLIGFGENRIGDALADGDADELLNGVVQAFQVLDVEGADDVDAGGQNILHILVALGVFAAGDVGMGQFVHDNDLGAAGEDGVGVHFLDGDAAVIDDFAAGDQFQAVDESLAVSARGRGFRRAR